MKAKLISVSWSPIEALPSPSRLDEALNSDTLPRDALRILSKNRPRVKATACGKKLSFSTMSEKMTDVNLALHIYRDFIEETPDVIAVLSGDLDVIPVLRMVRENAKKRGITVMNRVILPTQDDGLLFSRLPEHYRVAITTQLSETFLQKSLLPSKVEVMPGDWRTCPDTWV